MDWVYLPFRHNEVRVQRFGLALSIACPFDRGNGDDHPKHSILLDARVGYRRMGVSVMAARFLATLSLLIVVAIALTTAIGSLQGEGHMSEIAALNMVLVIGGGPIAAVLLLLAIVATPSVEPRSGDAPVRSRGLPNRFALGVISFGILVCGIWYFLRWNTPPWLVVSAFLLIYGAVIHGVFKATARPS